MFYRAMNIGAGLAAVGILAATAWAQAPAPSYKDDAERDLVARIQAEKDSAAKLAELKEWDQKYPDSTFKGMRAIMIVQTEAPIAQAGLQPNVAGAAADAAQKAAQDLADNADKYFSSENKQPNVTDAQWAGVKQQITLTAHTVLASLGAAKKTAEGDATAEAEYRKILALADSGGVSYSLGSTIIREIARDKKTERYPEALYFVAHSLAVTGQNALPAANRPAVDKYLANAYNGFHGSNDGLDELKKTATAAQPPAGFTIKSVVDIAKGEDAEKAKFAQEHPDLNLWRTIRDALTAADGQTYFESSVKDAGLPPPDGSFKMFTTKVVEQKSPSELLVALDGDKADVSLQFDPPLKGTIDPGTEVKFKGTVDSFQKEPYMLVFKDLGKEDVEGIPATAFPAGPAKAKAAPKAGPKAAPKGAAPATKK